MRPGFALLAKRLKFSWKRAGEPDILLDTDESPAKRGYEIAYTSSLPKSGFLPSVNLLGWPLVPTI